ncbi:TetR/AcrR family transcriptional regulator [Acinetobacter sp. MD2(2019)]|uniref:TetR/AcrR family transcriptional regulator n=1 Tax=Acinetobacter sp. MD2(2019) TaxID=2605273 RepID=UPI002D1F44E1|nr:TetR/AcrR family transcriptional regulator [Acinetobacter sp. MD2(2019)]MEB3753870.1 TetR/AcrR family transcriptional regulator [Acinetobacter sp. MD2(2019)]
MSTNQAKKSEEKRLYILETSFDLVLQKGFVGVGLQELLKSCGIPKGSFYHYFQSKEAFGCELLEHYISDYQARLNTLWSNTHSAKDNLLAYFHKWIEDSAEQASWADRCLIVKLAAEVADLSEDMRLIMEQGTKRLVQHICRLIQQGMDDASMHIQADPAQTAQVLYQMWLGAALLSKLHKDKAPLYQAYRATEFMLNGCKAV